MDTEQVERQRGARSSMRAKPRPFKDFSANETFQQRGLTANTAQHCQAVVSF